MPGELPRRSRRHRQASPAPVPAHLRPRLSDERRPGTRPPAPRRLVLQRHARALRRQCRRGRPHDEARRSRLTVSLCLSGQTRACALAQCTHQGELRNSGRPAKGGIALIVRRPNGRWQATYKVRGREFPESSTASRTPTPKPGHSQLNRRRLAVRGLIHGRREWLLTSGLIVGLPTHRADEWGLGEWATSGRLAIGIDP